MVINILESSSKLDWKFLVIFGVILFVVILLLNLVFSPMVQGGTLISEMCKKTDVSDAYKEAPIDNPWHKHIIEIKECYKDLVKIGWKQVSITSFDNRKLVGYLISKPNLAKGTVILVHSCHSYALREFAPLGKYYYSQGYNVLIIDQRCHNLSEGSYITYGYDEHKDLIDWVNFIDKQFDYKNPIYVHGVDMGAGVVSMIADKGLEDKVKGLIIEEGYLDGYTLFARFAITNSKYRNPAMTMKFANRRCRKALKFDLYDINPLECIKKTTIPCLFIVGSDFEHGTHETDTLYRECGASYKDMLVVFGATHGECYYRNHDEYLSRIKDLIKAGK